VRLSEVDNLRGGDEHPDKKPDKRFPALRLSLRAAVRQTPRPATATTAGCMR